MISEEETGEVRHDPFLVKICGLTREEDWYAARHSGADLVGFVFYDKSPRAVTPEQVREMGEELEWSAPPRSSRGKTNLGSRPAGEDPLRVGVFVNPTEQEIEEAAAAGKLGAVQIHGGAPLAGVRAARALGLVVILAMPVSGSLSQQQFEASYSNPPDAYLCDTSKPGMFGGTGERFNHEHLRPWLETHRLILAGGLAPDNIREAVSNLPGLFGCDVSSGVESAPGLKDPDRIHRFVVEARIGRAAWTGV